jgi:hypothetical protein
MRKRSVLVVVLVFSAVLAGCGDAANLSTFAGTYSGALWFGDLIVDANSLTNGSTIIKGVTTSVGGDISFLGTTAGSWVYLEADGKKIGVIVSAGDIKMIVLGATGASAAEESLGMLGVVPSGVVDGAIIGVWTLE